MDNIALLNEETSYWFDNGFKKITGESLYFSEYTTDSTGHYPISKLGTILKWPFAMIQHEAGAVNIPIALEFIVHSGTKIKLKAENETGYSTTIRYNPREPYNKSRDQLDQIASDWSTFPGIKTSSVGGRAYLQRHNDEETGYYTEEPQGEVRNYGSLGYRTDVYQLDVSDFWKGTIASTYGDAYVPWARTSIDGDWNINYLDVVICRDDANNRLIFVPLTSGYGVNVSDSVIDLYNITCAMGDRNNFVILGSIPYSKLNDTNYFDPEQDGCDALPDPDAPDFSGDTSITGGGKGNYINYPSDDIGLPQLPTVSAIDTGFLTMYNPTSGQLQQLVNYLWTSDWIDTVKKMISNPMDAIVSLQLAPYDIGTVASSTCKIGAVTTDISMYKVSSQYATLSAGTVSIPEHWGNALDYNNVNISIYIPFVGVRTLDTNLCMNATLSLTYYIDKLTGSGIAMLMVSKAGTSKSIYYTYDCNVNYQIPVTGANYAETIKAIMSLTASSVGLGASIATGNMGGAMTAGASMIGSAFMAGSGACHYEGSGNLSANTGMLGQFVPYVVIELPKQSLPNNFGHLKGYTSNITAKLGSLSGFTVVEQVHVDNIPGATDTEKQMIEAALKEGVII